MFVAGLLRRLALLSVLGAALVVPGLASAQGRPDCAAVLRELHNKKVMLHGHGPRTPDSVRVASQLNVDADWVDRCAQSYGRRIKRSEVRGAAGKNENDNDTLAEQREEQEYDEVSREEKDAAGEKYFTVIENDEQDRKKLERSRLDDDIEDEDTEVDTHVWEPDLGHPWEPYLHDDERTDNGE